MAYMKSSFAVNDPAAQNTVHFVDLYGRPFDLPFDQCGSAKSARDLIAEQLRCGPNIFEFFVQEHLVLDWAWSANVSPGATVLLRPSPAAALSRSPSPIPMPPMAAPPSSASSARLEEPPPYPDMPVLDTTNILNAQGLFKVPFDNCHDRVYRFQPESNDHATSQYRKLRNAPAERWSDLSGNVVPQGEATAPDELVINISPSIVALEADPHRGNYVYILVRKSNLELGPITRGGAGHLNGDSIHQWICCQSLDRVKAAVAETCTKNWSIVDSWPERRKGRFRRIGGYVKRGSEDWVQVSSATAKSLSDGPQRSILNALSAKSLGSVVPTKWLLPGCVSGDKDDE